MYRCGVDIVKTARIKEAIEKNDNFKTKVFTAKEIEYCEVKNEQQTLNHFAGRFAAKEAIYKAIPNAKEVIKSWKSIEIISEKGVHMKPKVYINGKYSENIDLSISHENEFAIAMCIYNENNV